MIVLWRLLTSRYWISRQYLREIISQPEESLFALARVYRETGGSPDILLSLTGLVRRTEWQFLADLCDGLYLLTDRPQAGLEILSQALRDEIFIKNEVLHLRGKDAWLTFYQTARVLYGVPSIVELSLQIPKLDKSVQLLEEASIEAERFVKLVEPLDRLSESGRIGLIRDRIAYLQEANFLLQQEEKSYAWPNLSIPDQIAQIINYRWRGLINANISELFGRPWFNPSLKTRRLVADREIEVVLELVNEGQAAARQVSIELAQSPQYGMVNSIKKIPYLQNGHAVSVNFPITPHNLEDIRLTFSITYFDAMDKFHHFEFADMATFLEGVRSYQKIDNPYAPGTPLRRGSPLFYGRRPLLDFVIINALQVYQQNVVVLVGQRRTGKTSILLHLSEIAPDHLLPVYVDCQSLGVTPGMVGFLHDLAWFIADACYLREIDIEVPDISAWEKDPAHAFQREFLPLVYKKLSKSGKILLIFDEFEAFEDLVKSEILPPTFFSYLRHLMQHADRLSFVFAGTHRLELMGSDYWSVFFNIALYRQVTYLEEEALRKLIILPVAPYLVYDDLALERIQRATAGHPYFVQLVCYTLVNYANKNRTQYITISDVNICLSEMLRLGEVHFAYLWQESTFAERSVLTAMAHLIETNHPVDPSQIAESLSAYDF
ncbi:MAG: AAA family ATPase, partial [Chloroflexota bacterium]